MVIKRFKARGFRNIESCDVSFSPGVNLLYGKNAQGKTNAIEGIYLFARGKSFRAREDKELLGFGREGFHLSLEYDDEDGTQTVEYASFGREKRRKKNGYAVKSVKEMIEGFRAVLFSPDDLRMVKDSPDVRRAFLNVAIGQINKIYIDDYSRYKVALENRNCLLKNAQKTGYLDINEIESWSYSMAEYAAKILVARVQYSKKLELYANSVISDISGGTEALTMKYESDVGDEISDIADIKNEYYRLLTENIEKERGAGVTLYGVHRDDLEIFINGASARSFASQGQQRSVVLALKIAEGEVCREMIGEYPVYLFDDVLSELDEKRKRYVLSRLTGKQIIITSCERDALSTPADLTIEVEGGIYRPMT